MIGISIATQWEFEAALEYYSIREDERFAYSYGEYFRRTINRAELVFTVPGLGK